MRNDILIFLLGGCCLGGVFMVLGVLLFTRVEGLFRRFFVVGIIQKVIGDTKEDVEAEAQADSVSRSHHVDLEAKAQSLDFDSALAKYKTGVAPTVSSQSAPLTKQSRFGQLLSRRRPDIIEDNEDE